MSEGDTASRRIANLSHTGALGVEIMNLESEIPPRDVSRS